MSEPKDILHRALGQYRGDDLERASAAFRNYTNAMMEQPYGQSGRTPRQIIAGYEQHAAECDAAGAWLEAQP